MFKNNHLPIPVGRFPCTNSRYDPRLTTIRSLPMQCSFSLRKTSVAATSYEMSGGAFLHPGPMGEANMTVFAVLPEPAALGLRRYDAYLVSAPPTGVYEQLKRVPNMHNVWTAQFKKIPPSIDLNSVLYIGGSALHEMAAPPGHRVLLEGRLANCK